MNYKRISDLGTVNTPNKTDKILISHNTFDYEITTTITIEQLLGMEQEALNRPCHYCGSRGKYDRRGNCGACGAPVVTNEA